uniref:Uncharacterized protein n=1 Tax=Strongyloides venezuelensis TaxID=75913 RepID=A0A0K0FNR6_STRVS
MGISSDDKNRCFSDDFNGNNRNSTQLSSITSRGRTNSCFTNDDDVTIPKTVDDFSKGLRPTLKDIIKKVPLESDLQNNGITTFIKE